MHASSEPDSGSQRIDEASVADGGLWGGRLIRFDELPSTNSWAMANADVLRHGDVVRAGAQTAGRGRFDRRWSCPSGRGLALSVMLDGTMRRPELPLQVTALALVDTLADAGMAPAVKWPNDVLVGGAKIAGLLAETVGEKTVLGIGLNVNLAAPDFAEAGLTGCATSMCVSAGREFDIEGIQDELLRSLQAAFERIGCDSDLLLQEWAAHDALRGEKVSIDCGGSVAVGQYRGVDRRGRLLLRDADGVERAFWSGDVTRVRS